MTRTPFRAILSVDDSESDQYLNALAIRDVDPEIEVLAAYDGAEALEILAKLAEPPDLILLDINMPGMDGFGFLEAYVQAYGRDDASLIVMLTSSMLDEDRARGLRYWPVRGFLAKPLGRDWAEKVAALQGGSGSGSDAS